MLADAETMSELEVGEPVKRHFRSSVVNTGENGVVNENHHSTAVLQRCFPQNELQGRRIRLYRNGDRFFKGVWYTVIPSLRSWSAFLEDLQKIHFFIGCISLPQGVRFIFQVNGDICNTLEEIQHGKTYVVSSTDKFKSIDYANASQPMWSFVSSKLSEPPKYGLRETFTREPNEFVKPRIITVIRNGIKPRRVVRHLLNKKTAQSFDMVISDITAIIKLNSGVVRKLYSLNGKQVSVLADFFRDDYIFIAYGTERISLDDFYVISEEYKRMEISKNKPPRLNGQFKLRPTQLKMLSKRTDSKAFKKENSVCLNGEVDLPLELKECIKVLELLGDGNTALVYKALFREGVDRWELGALKIVREETLRNEEVLNFVRSEVELLRSLNHEHIVQLKNCQILEGSWFIHMELVQEGDLFEILRKKRSLNEQEAASCVQGLCKALEYLHSEHLIVHRDVKLENLLVYLNGERMVTKLADFGLAQRLESPDQLLYQLCGTPTYVAPEVLAEFGYSFKADCWSVGIIVFILLCGYPPFGVDEPDEVLFNRILRGQFEFPALPFNSVSSSAKLLIARLLSTDPNSRFSASNVLEYHWIKHLAVRDEWIECEAEAHLATAMAGINFDESDDDDSCEFAISESSAEFFFSRRTSMDELGEPSGSAENKRVTETLVVGGTREFAQKHLLMSANNGKEASSRDKNPTERLTVGKETPRTRRKGASGGPMGNQFRNSLA